MPSYTPNYNFAMPLVNNATDQDLWGGYLNTNWSSLDTILETIASTPSIPSGMIVNFPVSVPPTGYLECNGSLQSRTTNPNLWTFAQASGNIVADGAWAKGHFSTGDGATTFRIPDLRGEFVRGWDDGAGVDAGRGIGSAQADGVGPLGISDPGHAHATPSFRTSSGGVAFGSGPANMGDGSGTYGAYTGIQITGTTTETRPKNIALMFCIKT